MFIFHTNTHTDAKPLQVHGNLSTEAAEFNRIPVKMLMEHQEIAGYVRFRKVEICCDKETGTKYKFKY